MISFRKKLNLLKDSFSENVAKLKENEEVLQAALTVEAFEEIEKEIKKELDSLKKLIQESEE
jgi:predicted CopG family antitoxin